MMYRFTSRVASGGYSHTPLSNFSEHSVTVDDVEYPTMEHYYQAMKTLDKDEREKIRLCDTPAKAKKMGRRVTLRANWEPVKLFVMRKGLEDKFTTESDAGQYLLGTGDQGLIEGNDWGDMEWGMVYKDGQWVGNNWLGMLLMARRAQLRAT